MGDVEFLPGTRAMFIFTDEHGTRHTSVVEIICRKVVQDDSLYVVRAKAEVSDLLMRVAKELESEDCVIGVVAGKRLLPIGQRNFTIIK